MAKKVVKKGVKKASTKSKPRGGGKKTKKATSAKASGKTAATRTKSARTTSARKKNAGRTSPKAGAKSNTSTTARSKTTTPRNATRTTTGNAAGKNTRRKPAAKPAAAAAVTPPVRTKPAPPRPVHIMNEITTIVAEPLSDAQLRRAKSGLTRGEIQDYRNRLMKKRFELIGDVEALENDARTDSGDHFSPEHMADIGSNAYAQELTLGLVESEQRLLREIDEALMRIANRTYGVCRDTGKPIGKPRLDAKPWAQYCIEVARDKERMGQM